MSVLCEPDCRSIGAWSCATPLTNDTVVLEPYLSLPRRDVDSPAPGSPAPRPGLTTCKSSPSKRSSTNSEDSQGKSHGLSYRGNFRDPDGPRACPRDLPVNGAGCSPSMPRRIGLSAPVLINENPVRRAWHAP